MGREALDAEAIRLLEEHNPDVAFDWPRLLKAASAPIGPAAAGAPVAREERRRDRRPGGRGPERGGGGDHERERDRGDGRDRGGETGSASARERESDTEFPSEGEPITSSFANPDLPEPSEAEEAAEVTVTTTSPAAPLESRYARLGEDGLARLRGRYADIRSRIDGKTLDEPERAELLAKAERLNPDAWQTEEEVTHALEEYEAVFEALRPLVGRQPRPGRL